MANKSGVSEQIISVPKGGGALRGIGEKFAPDLFTGTGNFTVPIAVPPGRNGFQPQLSLVYSTGNGNGVFGLGWSLSIPGVSRKTSKGIPRFHDYDPKEESDVFILSGAEDLVLVDEPAPNVSRYRPRTEGLFALIDHHHSAIDDHWEVRSTDGLISIYGTPARRGDQDPAAIAADDTRKFAWKLTETRDPFNNRIVYTYLSDSGQNDHHRWKQPMLSRIEYAEQGDDATHFLISVSFEYEDRVEDAFSDYRAGFEIRTTQRCKAATVETHFGQTRRVRTYRFTYDNGSRNGHSLLTRIDVVGYDDADQEVQELPPITSNYSVFDPVMAEKRDLISISGNDLPPGNLGRPEYELADLTGDGLPDVLEMNGTVRYWRNLGHGRFDLPRTMREAPPVHLADPGVQMLDATGDGRIDLMVTAHPLAGYYSLEHNGEWDKRRSFQRYSYAPSFDLEDPEVKLLDLDGDGITDALRSNVRLECYFQSPQKGWDPERVRFVPRKRLEEFPDVNFSDPRVKLADMTGDGLQDIVLVYDGNIEYWPNLGYGNWGKRIHMRNSPRFRDSGYTFGYDPKRVLIGDVDGDGLADIVYVDDKRVVLWINRSGDAWSDPIEIYGTPPVTDIDAVRLVDLLGMGISGVLWSADANGQGRPSAFFLDFTGGIKPYLLNEMDNHLGATTKVEYRSSTHYYLEDRKHLKTRWKTSLPFPVHVVARVEVIDHFSRGKLTTAYRYHHGYWDGAEREFRGFGMVEQLDTETFQVYREQGLHGSVEFAGVHERHFSPPTLTRTWFHQGPVEDDSGEWRELDGSGVYWSGDPSLLGHTESVNAFLRSLPDRPSRRDALRTLRGSVLRTELYALDRLVNQNRIWPEDRPYTISEQAYSIREEQPPPNIDPHRKRIFFPHNISQRTTQWERGDDPMTQFGFTDYRDEIGRADEFGRPRRRTAVAMPRRAQKRLPFTAAIVGTVQSNETRVLATHNKTTYAEPDQNLYVNDRTSETRSYELKQPPEVAEQDELGNDISDSVTEVLKAQYRSAQEIHQQFIELQNVHLIGHVINHFDGQPFTGRNDSKVGPYGALTRIETLVFRDEELDEAYSSRRPTYLRGTANLPAGAPPGFGNDLGYRWESVAPYTGGYYADTQCRRYDFQEAGLAPHGLAAWPRHGFVTALQDLRGNTATIQPDRYWLLPERVRDAAGLEVSAVYNYRVMQPSNIVDANGNSTYFGFSANCLLQKQWLVSHSGQQGGTEAKPEGEFGYNLQAYDRTRNEAQPQPGYAHSKQRIWHASDNRDDEFIEAREYSDGFGRLLQKRAQAEELVFGTSGDDVGLPVDAGINPAVATGLRVSDRVIVSGWQAFDNKGRTVEKFEPYFSTDWAYEPDIKYGQHAEMTYDPRGQVIHTLNPDGSEQRIIYGIPRDLHTPEDFEPTPWEMFTYDGNDLATIATTPGGISLALRIPALHYFTPVSALINAGGRIIAQIDRNGPTSSDWYLTRSHYDVRGNLIEIIERLGRPAFQYAYDLLNRPLKVASIDAGLRTSVLDATGSLVEYRDSKGSVVLRQYDVLNRPTEVWAVDDSNTTQQLTQCEKIIYGDQASLLDVLDRNLLGKPHRHYDEAGLLTFERYDFKGNLIEKSRRVVSDQAITVGWAAHWEDGAQAEVDLDPAMQAYQTDTSFDALNRPIKILYPRELQPRPGETVRHRAELIPVYNRAGALLSVRLDNAVYVDLIAYNAKGQRVLIAYGNGVMTRYCYDDKTFHLVRLRTERLMAAGADIWRGIGVPLQDYTYTYDLVGNILGIEERAPGCGVRNNPDAIGATDNLFRTLLSAGDALSRRFGYDPLYRLVTATGREGARLSVPCSDYDLRRNGFGWAGNTPATSPENAKDVAQLYEERYVYDPAGNLLRLNRSGSATRYFGMGGVSPNEWQTKLDQPPGGPAPDWGDQGNRLTNFGNKNARQTHLFDANGNLIQEDTERSFTWDHADRMTSFRHQATPTCPASLEARYLYGADGTRVKKWVRTNGTGDGESTVYIDNIFEHLTWRKNGQSGQTNNIHVMDSRSRVAILRVGVEHPDVSDEPVQYHLGDHLGSSAVVVGGADATASNFLNGEEFFPYGETSLGSYARKRYRFTGKERDEESGLNYHGARYYGPNICRWMSADPVLDKPPSRSVQSYSYCDGRPLVAVDPDGRSPILVGLLIALFLLPNTANAPGPRDRIYRSMSEGEFVVQFALIYGTAGLGVAVERKLMFHIGESVLGRTAAGMSGGLVGGTTYGAASLGASDLFAGEMSSPEAYKRAIMLGAFFGAALGGIRGRLTPAPPIISDRALLRFLMSTYKQSPILQDLSQVWLMEAGPARMPAMVDVLKKFSSRTGVKVDIVEPGAVQKATGQQGNYASFNSRPGYLQIERHVGDMQIPNQLLNEITHEIAAYETQRSWSRQIYNNSGGVPMLEPGRSDTVIHGNYGNKIMDNIVEKQGSTDFVPR